jgi:hypothetical protein
MHPASRLLHLPAEGGEDRVHHADHDEVHADVEHEDTRDRHVPDERHGAGLFYLCHFEGADAPRPSTMIGRGGPLHATAIGKALISELSREEISELVGDSYARYTPRTITGIDELTAALDTVRAAFAGASYPTASRRPS